MIKCDCYEFKTVFPSSNTITYKLYLCLFPIILISQNVITVLRRCCKEDSAQDKKETRGEIMNLDLLVIFLQQQAPKNLSMLHYAGDCKYARDHNAL